MQDKPLEQVTYRIIGAAMRVHNELGPGLKEAFYQRALLREFERAGLAFEQEYSLEVQFDGGTIGLLYLDHFVEGAVIVEEKAISHLLTQDELAQVITYLCATKAPVGLLINFGRSLLEYRRIFPPRNVERWQERIRRYVWTPREHKQSVNPVTHPLTGLSVPALPGSHSDLGTSRP